MSIGLGVFLVALGAILSFAVRDTLTGVDLVVVGYILMGSGLAVIVFSFVVDAQRRRRTGTTTTARRDDATTRLYRP